MVLSLSVFCQIGSKKHLGNITGNWVNDSLNLRLILTPHGTGEFRGDAVQYVKHADKLHISKSAVTTVYTFALVGDILTLSGGDLDNAVTFRRTAPIASGLTQHEISEQNIPKELLGLWTGYNETIEFKPDAQCIYRDRPWPYLVSNDVIKLQTVQGNFIMHYKIQSDNLHLTFNGADHVYTRHVESVNEHIEPVHKLDTTLIGRWCYGFVRSGSSASNSECFQLNDDGTYVYMAEAIKQNVASDTTRSTDTGNWWSEGTQLFLNSANQGKAAYTLKKMNHPKTGDAMIVLNGKNYISYDRRKPW